MALGQLLRQARLEAGLSQRQLCGEEITRNMLSQIENGTARPSMDTLRYLAERLGKPVSWFLEEDTTPANQHLLSSARKAFLSRDFAGVLERLEYFEQPDEAFDAEMTLLKYLALLGRAEQAVEEQRLVYAEDLLQQAGMLRSIYCEEDLQRRRLLLLDRVQPDSAQAVVSKLPGIDGELLLRARAALQQADADRCLELLCAVEDKTAEGYCLLSAEACFAKGEYAAAIPYYERAEQQALDRLEQCYERLEDYKMAYHYARLQRKENE